MSRRSVKNSLSELLTATPGVLAVYPYMPRSQMGLKFPSIIVTINGSDDEPRAVGSPGRRLIKYHVSLYIQHLDHDPDEQSAQLRFDDMLDSVDAQLRSDKTLGGTVLYSAHDSIVTEVFDPQIAGQGISVIYRAMKNFDVCVEIMA